MEFPESYSMVYVPAHSKARYKSPLPTRLQRKNDSRTAVVITRKT